MVFIAGFLDSRGVFPYLGVHFPFVWESDVDPMSNILEKVNEPADLKALSVDEMTQLAAEIRMLLIETISKTGGHLASNLGVVELTLALLRVFTPPADKIIWDVSHQTYTYKILTGRKDRFGTLRQYGGLSGFLSRKESPCDAFGAGHSGTALSAALGMAAARDRQGGKNHVVAVVGDASLGGGVSFEALNNVESSTKRLILILNCLLYTSPSPRDRQKSRMPSSA